MILTPTYADQLARFVLETLKDLNAADPAAVRALLETRVPCNEALAEHPNCYVTADNQVGALGLLNGILNRATGRVIVISGHYQSQRHALFRAGLGDKSLARLPEYIDAFRSADIAGDYERLTG